MRHYVYKYRLYPNMNQEIYFSKCFGCSRLIWNLLLDAKRNYYANYKVMLKREVSFYKSMKKYEFLKEVDSLALSNAKMNLDIAFSRFFNKISGLPRFKKKGVNKDTYTTNNSITSNGISKIRIVGSYIRLPKIGLVKIELHRPLEGKIKKVNQSISDTGIGMFIEMLKYKADLYGRTIKTVSKYYPSSQMCSSCGSINKGMKKLNKRTLVCNKCGVVLDRDVNAAINILKGCS